MDKFEVPHENAVLCVTLRHGCMNICQTATPFYLVLRQYRRSETSEAVAKEKVELITDGIILDMSLSCHD